MSNIFLPLTTALIFGMPFGKASLSYANIPNIAGMFVNLCASVQSPFVIADKVLNDESEDVPSLVSNLIIGLPLSVSPTYWDGAVGCCMPSESADPSVSSSSLI